MSYAGYANRHRKIGLASSLDLRAQAEGQLHALLLAEGIAPRAVYRPGEVCQLLRISPTTLRQFCELSEHPAVKNADPRSRFLSGRLPSPDCSRGAGGMVGQKPEVSARGVKVVGGG